VGAAPPATPLEKYKLRIAVGKRTGRMDLACKSVWHTADDSASNTTRHQSNNSVAPSPKSRPSAGDLEAEEAEIVTDGDGGDAAASGGADGPQEEADGVFLTQEGEEVQFKATGERAAAEGEEEVEESVEGIFDQVATVRDGEADEVGGLEVASLSLVVSGSQQSDPTGSGSNTKVKRRPREMLLDFRLSVIPIEVMRLTGNLLLLIFIIITLQFSLSNTFSSCY
jgi:hypothetical protein